MIAESMLDKLIDGGASEVALRSELVTRSSK